MLHEKAIVHEKHERHEKINLCDEEFKTRFGDCVPSKSCLGLRMMDEWRIFMTASPLKDWQSFIPFLLFFVLFVSFVDNSFYA
jgi:hypothetical protein